MPPSAFLVGSTIRTKTLTTPTPAAETVGSSISTNRTNSRSIYSPLLIDTNQEEETIELFKFNQNNNCQTVKNYNFITEDQHQKSQRNQQQLNNMVLQSYDNYATYHLPAHHHHHHHLHHHQQQQQQHQRAQQLQHQQQQHQLQQNHTTSTQQQQQHQLLTEQQFDATEHTSIYQQNNAHHLPVQPQTQQQPQQQLLQQQQQQRLSSGSSTSSSSTASSIVGSNPATSASLGLGYFNELSNFINTDFSATHQHAATNLYYTDIDANFFSQGKNRKIVQTKI